jgi:hypothetical protein
MNFILSMLSGSVLRNAGYGNCLKLVKIILFDFWIFFARSIWHLIVRVSRLVSFPFELPFSVLRSLQVVGPILQDSGRVTVFAQDFVEYRLTVQIPSVVPRKGAPNGSTALFGRRIGRVFACIAVTSAIVVSIDGGQDGYGQAQA